jgi:hypothetical protein
MGQKDTILMLRNTPATKMHADSGADVLAKVLTPFEFGGEAYLVSAFPGEVAPIRVADLANQTRFLDGAELARLGSALRALSTEAPHGFAIIQASTSPRAIRGARYGEAASKGTPQAIQVVDRRPLIESASGAFLDAVPSTCGRSATS